MGDRLVFLHGFTQTHHHWHTCALALAQRRDSIPTLVFVDLPGHGLSGGDRSPIDATAGQLGALAGPGTYIGYSMGGRTALLAAVAGAPEIERLVLIGATAGIEDPAERAARVAADSALSDRVERDGVERFVDEWLAQPMFASLPADRDDRDDDRRHRIRNTAGGLASSLRLAGTGAQPSVWDQLGALSIPVLVMAGAGDAKFTAIAERLAAAIPRAAVASIPGAGHAAHSEQPEATAEIIAGWLA